MHAAHDRAVEAKVLGNEGWPEGRRGARSCMPAQIGPPIIERSGGNQGIEGGEEGRRAHVHRRRLRATDGGEIAVPIDVWR